MLWKEKVNSEEFKVEILDRLNSLYRWANKSILYPKVWKKRESYLPKVRMRLIDVPSGLYLIIYKDLARHEMAIAYEDRGVVYEALIENLDSHLNHRTISFYNVYYLAVYPEGSQDIIPTILYPKNRMHIYIPCGYVARCMPKEVFQIVWDALRKFSIL